MSNIIRLPDRRQTIIEVTRAWVHPPDEPDRAEYCFVVVLLEPDGSEICVWSGDVWTEAINVAELWREDYPNGHIVISCDPDDDPDGPDDGERLAA